jgi:LPS sulfotransferase NodH
MPDQRLWDQFGSDFDFPDFRGTPQSYVIASSGRTGSHLLAALLFDTGLMGAPFEYLHPKHSVSWQERLAVSGSLAEVLNALVRRRTSPNGVFGVKAHWPQFQPLLKVGLPDFMQQARYIRITRRDRIAQAVSMEIARQSGAWISHHVQKAAPVYCGDSIRKTLADLQREDAAWSDYFTAAGIEPVPILYEDLIADPGSNVAMILAHFGLEARGCSESPAHAPKRQATALNEEWISRFRAEYGSSSNCGAGS